MRITAHLQKARSLMVTYCNDPEDATSMLLDMLKEMETENMCTSMIEEVRATPSPLNQLQELSLIASKHAKHFVNNGRALFCSEKVDRTLGVPNISDATLILDAEVRSSTLIDEENLPTRRLTMLENLTKLVKLGKLLMKRLLNKGWVLFCSKRIDRLLETDDLSKRDHEDTLKHSTNNQIEEEP